MNKPTDSVLSIGFRVDTPQLLKEIADAGLPRNAGVLKVPLNVFQNLLLRVAERAIKLNDPDLNILMLSLNLYEVSAFDIPRAIENQIELKNAGQQLTIPNIITRLQSLKAYSASSGDGTGPFSTQVDWEEDETYGDWVQKSDIDLLITELLSHES